METVRNPLRKAYWQKENAGNVFAKSFWQRRRMEKDNEIRGEFYRELLGYRGLPGGEYWGSRDDKEQRKQNASKIWPILVNKTLVAGRVVFQPLENRIEKQVSKVNTLQGAEKKYLFHSFKMVNWYRRTLLTIVGMAMADINNALTGTVASFYAAIGMACLTVFCFFGFVVNALYLSAIEKKATEIYDGLEQGNRMKIRIKESPIVRRILKYDAEHGNDTSYR